ncbi:hypothetical protein SLS64_000614 [Diaporthe eres]
MANASKTSPMVPRVNTYEDQYVCSLAERLFMLMDQQFRMLPGLFDPARDAFDHRQGIEDVMTPGADTAIAHNVEMWVMDNGCSPPPPGKYWPVSVDVPGTKCKAVKLEVFSQQVHVEELLRKGPLAGLPVAKVTAYNRLGQTVHLDPVPGNDELHH